MSLLDDLGRSSEAVILRRARTGDGAAFGWLYEQHVGAARRLARSLVADRSDADDVVSEVFAAAFAAMRKGLGPQEDFRSYLLTSVRRECHRTWRKGARQRPGGDAVVDLASARSAPRDDFAWFDEGDVVHRAFATLSPRLQHVLWLTEIEGLSHDEVAVRLGTSSTNVAQLARRARLEFGERYLDEHLPTPEGPLPQACTGPRRVLAEVVRGTASRRAERLAAEHMAACASCSDAEVELKVVNGRLRTGHLFVLLPALTVSRPARLGVLARFLAWVAGPAPAMSAVVTLAVATAVAPMADHVPEPVSAGAPPAAEVVVDATATPTTAAGATADPRRATVTDEDVARPSGGGSIVDAFTFDPTAGAATPSMPTAPDAGAAAEPAGVPLDAAAIAPGAAVPGVVPGSLPVPVPDVPGLVEDVVARTTIDDPLVDAIGPVVSLLPRTDIDLALPSTPPLGPVGPTPPVDASVEIGGGEVDVEVSVGPADVGVAVGGPGGIAVDLPAVPEVVQALPAPVPQLVQGVPLVGAVLGG